MNTDPNAYFFILKNSINIYLCLTLKCSTELCTCASSLKCSTELCILLEILLHVIFKRATVANVLWNANSVIKLGMLQSWQCL